MSNIKSAKTGKGGASFKAHVSARGILCIEMNPKHQKRHGSKAASMALGMFPESKKVMFI